jgi:hypothetical protein
MYGGNRSDALSDRSVDDQFSKDTLAPTALRARSAYCLSLLFHTPTPL